MIEHFINTMINCIGYGIVILMIYIPLMNTLDLIWHMIKNANSDTANNKFVDDSIQKVSCIWACVITILYIFC